MFSVEVSVCACQAIKMLLSEARGKLEAKRRANVSNGGAGWQRMVPC